MSGFPTGWHTQAIVLLVDRSYLVEEFVAGQGKRSHTIQQRDVLCRQVPFLLHDEAPTIPWEEFDLIEREEVPYDVASDEPHAAHIGDAEVIRVGAA